MQQHQLHTPQHYFILKTWNQHQWCCPSHQSQTFRVVPLTSSLGFVYSLLSSGCVSSIPTPPSAEDSVFRETGTNNEVSGGFREELLDETSLLQSTEPGRRCPCNKPDPEDTWQIPAVIRGVRELKCRWSREIKQAQRFIDMAAVG